ncbi:MAG: hypothetical protein DRQ56_05770 [Gammaproteobacteria bacterium]|nr:MAG: hypothetical protein DRQ56_05770 [Gammaproteobacteria bacterium]
MSLFVDGVEIKSVFIDGVEQASVVVDGVEVYSGTTEFVIRAATITAGVDFAYSIIATATTLQTRMTWAGGSNSSPIITMNPDGTWAPGVASCYANIGGSWLGFSIQASVQGLQIAMGQPDGSGLTGYSPVLPFDPVDGWGRVIVSCPANQTGVIMRLKGAYHTLYFSFNQLDSDGYLYWDSPDIPPHFSGVFSAVSSYVFNGVTDYGIRGAAAPPGSTTADPTLIGAWAFGDEHNGEIWLDPAGRFNGSRSFADPDFGYSIMLEPRVDNDGLSIGGAVEQSGMLFSPGLVYDPRNGGFGTNQVVSGNDQQGGTVSLRGNGNNLNYECASTLFGTGTGSIIVISG